MQNAVLSYGLGVDSTAIFLRWIYEHEIRPCAIENITAITAMTADEFGDTARRHRSHLAAHVRAQNSVCFK